MHLDLVPHQVHQPDLAHTRTRVERQLDRLVVLKRAVGDLDQQQHVVRRRWLVLIEVVPSVEHEQIRLRLERLRDSRLFDRLQAAAGLCLSRTNPSVEIEHWLIKLAEAPNSDLVRLFRHFEVDPSHLLRDLTRAIDQFRTGNARTPTLAPSIDQLVREAWVLASVQYKASSIRSGVLLLALLDDDKLGRLARDASRELAKIQVEALFPNLLKIVAGSEEDEGPAVERAPGEPAATGGVSKTPSLDQYTINLTDRARKGKIDPVIGRDSEIRQMIDILIRRRQNNPILTGEAGVGKTAVVEGFALRIAQGDVPPDLQKVELRTLDLGLLQAGAGVKGEFENRLKQVIAEVKASPVPIILFIDEAHTMIGAGGQAGQGDAANLLKPALARGDLRTIAATTWAEYKKYFEKDAALVCGPQLWSFSGRGRAQVHGAGDGSQPHRQGAGGEAR